MRRHVSRPPGWYPDAGDPHRVAYFDGHDFTGDRRPRPSWSASPLRLARLHPEPTTRSRRVLPAAIALLLVVGLAALSALGGEIGPIRSSPGREPIVGDVAWSHAVNALCRSDLPPLGPERPLLGRPTVGFSAKTVPPALAGAVLVALEGDLERTAAGIARVPAPRAAEPAIAGWLGDWSELNGILAGQRVLSAGELGAAQGLATNIDRFAATNGLPACRL